MRSGLISVLGVLGVLSPAAAMAQEPPGAAPLEPAYSGNRPLGLYPGGESEYVRNGRAMRRVGIPLTIAGAIALPMGIVLTSVAAGCAYTGACSYPAYAALTGFGLVGMAARRRRHAGRARGRLPPDFQRECGQPCPARRFCQKVSW